jgi:hypoxanthine phosphoribosyltransferase
MTRQRVLISRERIADRVAQIGRELSLALNAEADQLVANKQHPGPVVMVPVLTGAMIFVADLIRAMPVSMSIKPVTLSSYPGKSTTSQGVTVQSGVPTDLRGCRVILVDDILDSGQTLGLLKRMIQAQHVQSIRTVVLLNKSKPGGRKEHVDVEYAGFDIEDEFVVGYGLDYDGLYRNVPDILVLAGD